MPAIVFEQSNLMIATDPTGSKWKMSNQEPGSPVSVYYSPNEKAEISYIEDKLIIQKSTPVQKGYRGTHDAKTMHLQGRLDKVTSIARARSTMLSYTKTPLAVRTRSLSIDQTEFVKEEKTPKQLAAEYNSWRREYSENNLASLLAKAVQGEEKEAPSILMVKDEKGLVPKPPSSVTRAFLNIAPGAYSRTEKMGDLDSEDEEDEIAYFGIDSAPNNRRARPLFRDFYTVMRHIARSR